MNDWLLLVFSLSACTFGNVVRKFYVSRGSNLHTAGFLYTAITSLVAALTLIIINGFGDASGFTVWLGIAFGALTAFQSITNIIALHTGPLSYTTVIISFSTLISALSGLLFFDESIAVSQIIGIALMLVSFVLAVNKDGGEKRASAVWLITCILAFFSTGFIGVLQKVHQNTEYKGEIGAFLVVAFFTSAVISFAVMAVLSKKERAFYKEIPKGSLLYLLLGCMAIGGICAALNNKWNLYLSGVIDSAVFFPVVNGGGLVLTTLAALLVFKEKLTRKQWVGLIFGIDSVIFLCNPFA